MVWIKPKTYKNPVFPYQRFVDQDAPTPVRHQVVIFGSGPAGLTAALDLAGRNIPSVILTQNRTVSVGNRAICFAKKTLETMNRVELGDKMRPHGLVIWGQRRQ
ncbi:MAG: FAD-dependent monooxygenase [Lewinellaceae bacterium]|nr:FAD-dependent monooxygenase [Lewinellaceae bacterium]